MLSNPQPNPVWVGFFAEAKRLATQVTTRLLAALPDISRLVEVESDDPRLVGDWRDFVNPCWREQQHPGELV